MNQASLRAIPAPADAVFPQAGGDGFLGVLMLQTRFPRPPGDIGHPASFRAPVVHRVVAGAFPREVVRSAKALRASGLAARFADEARALADAGAAAITTSCGFFVLLQQELQAAVAVPLVSSSLLQLQSALASGPRVGVLTISAEHLGADHLLAAGVPAQRLDDVVVQGVDAAGPFAQALLGNHAQMDLAAAERDVVAAAQALKARAPDLRDRARMHEHAALRGGRGARNRMPAARAGHRAPARALVHSVAGGSPDTSR